MINDVYSIRIVTRVKNEFCFTQLHYLETAATDATFPAESLGVAFDLVHFDNICQVLSDEAALVEQYVRRIYPFPGIPYAHSMNAPGLIAGEPLPPLAPAITTFYTSLLSRSGRGRAFWSGLSEAWQDGGNLINLALSAMQGLADALQSTTLSQAGGGPGRWKLAVYSPTNVSAGEVIVAAARPNLARMGTRRTRPQTA